MICENSDIGKPISFDCVVEHADSDFQPGNFTRRLSYVREHAEKHNNRNVRCLPFSLEHQNSKKESENVPMKVWRQSW